MFFRITAAFLSLVAFAHAQDFRATLSGQVTDPSGSAIPNATVKATNLTNKEVKDATTNADGYYTLPYLEPGNYNIDVTATGFQTLTRELITLQVAAKVNLPLKLAVGQISQQMTVVGMQEVIDTASADRGLVFDPIKTQELPLNGRQTYMLMALTPGVVFTQEQFGASGFSGTRAWDVNNSYKINGARTGENLFLLNGAPISNNGGTWQIAPNVEAVQEFKVMTNTYDASYGRFGGGVVNTTLKSGGNAWHGDVYDYFRNRVFDANTFQNNTAGLPKGFHNQHQFGGVAGGPIRKEKDFIFGSFEGWQEVVPFPALSSTPPLALRDGQHFTDFGYKIFDPLTTHVCQAPEPCNGQTYIANQFPGNVIPQSRISPIGQKLLSFYPAPTNPGINNNFVAAGNLGRYYYEQPMIRWDHVFGDNDKFYAIFTYFQGHEYRSTSGFPKPAAQGNANNERADRNIILDETHIVSASTVLDVRASFGRFVQTTPGYSDYTVTAASVGMTGMIHSPTYPNDVVPRIQVGGYNDIFSNGATYAWNSYNQYNITPSLTMNRGHHTVRTGFEINYVTNGNTSTGAATGSLSFNSSWTQQNQARQQGPLDGSGVATLLLGYPAGGSPNGGYIDYNQTQYRSRPYYGVYVQDDWKINQRLTANFGLRYDVQIPWLERYNRENRGFDPNAKNPYSDQVLAAWKANKTAYDAANPNAKFPYPNPPAILTGVFVFPGVGGQSQRLYNTDWSNVAPRVGFAYRAFNQTVIRGGAGMYYQSSTQSGTTNGFTQTTPYTASLDGGVTPSAGARLTGPYTLQQPFPNGLLAPLGASFYTGAGNGISYDSIGFQIPKTYQYSLGFQQGLPYGIVAEVSYAGNYQNHINLGQNLNHEPFADQQIAIADPSYYSRSVPNPFYGILPLTTSLGGSPTISANNLLRPDPIYQGLTDNLIQQGWYRSDQLQVLIQKRAFGTNSGAGAGGVLTWAISYAFAKAFESNHRLNDWNTLEPLIKELDNTDKAQNASFHGVWDPPIGHGHRFLSYDNRFGRGLADGWRLDWVLSYSSGNPTGWPNLVNTCGSWQAANQNENSWFNNDKSCYKQPLTNSLRVIPDRFPNIRDPAQGPQLNAALEKTIPFGERYKLQLRAESFNVTNYPIRPGPNTDINNAIFGQLPKSQNNFPRLIQFAGKFFF